LLTIRTIEYFDSVSSTNDRLKELLRQSVPPQLPCLVTARQQTAGRGRGNKVWWSSEGALLLSLGVELSALSLERTHLSLLSLAAGLAALETIRHRLPEENHTALHWPNDVYVDGKKIGGILLESPTPQHLVLGIGINVNNRLTNIPTEFLDEFEKKPITSLIEILEKPTDIPFLIADFCERLSGKINQITTNPAELVQNVERCCLQVGKNLTIHQDHGVIQGYCLGIDQNGSLRLKTPNGTETIQTGIAVWGL
jgi:BirA family biotin operon repressor/biotin-[acetyl-CoA-carboxylase] ligase